MSHVDMQPCPECLGSGKDDCIPYNPCPICGGDGWVEVTADWDDDEDTDDD